MHKEVCQETVDSALLLVMVINGLEYTEHREYSLIAAAVGGCEGMAVSTTA